MRKLVIAILLCFISSNTVANTSAFLTEFTGESLYLIFPRLLIDSSKYVLVLRIDVPKNEATPALFFRCLNDGPPEMENNVWVETNPNGPGYEDDSGFEFTGCGE